MYTNIPHSENPSRAEFFEFLRKMYTNIPHSKNPSRAEFFEFLRKMYTNIPRAWRFAFDLDGSGKLSRREFVQAARDRANYRGDIMSLFKSLDLNSDSLISLNEMDNDAYVLLKQFEKRADALYSPSLYDSGGKKSFWKQMTRSPDEEVAATARVGGEADDRISRTRRWRRRRE